MHRSLSLALCLAALLAVPAPLAAQTPASAGPDWSRAVVVHVDLDLDADVVTRALRDGVLAPPAVDVLCLQSRGPVPADLVEAARAHGLALARAPHGAPSDSALAAWRAAGFDAVLRPGETPVLVPIRGDAPSLPVQRVAPDSLREAGALERIFARDAALQLTTTDGGAAPHLWLAPGPILVPLDALTSSVVPLAAFRARHPAVGAGRHRQLSAEPYVFWRSFRQGRVHDDVVVVLGGEGRLTIPVSHAFADDTVVRDALTGKIGLVAYGTVSLPAAPGGLLLIEAVE